ncbi:MAG: ribosomal protein S18-alanine N-acetyltransferase, partial [Coriobacteriia bacterium]|nr:ribosomal protein S18-alanine N-acetyltransferase [Coriobacteriia bacterium]
MSALIREMQAADLDVVLAIETQAFSTPWQRGMFEEELERTESRAWLVLEWGGCVLGYGGIMLVEDDAHIMNLALRADCRGCGLGMALLVRLVQRAREMGARYLTLEVRENNNGARTLYEQAGMRSVGVRHGYYADSGEHAVIMRSDDMSSPGEAARL